MHMKQRWTLPIKPNNGRQATLVIVLINGLVLLELIYDGQIDFTADPFTI